MARPISTKYRRRVGKVYGVTAWLREEAKKDYIEGLKEATQQQLYDKTPLPVTMAMMESIGGRIVSGVVEVGYNVGKGVKARYAGIRLNMKGISVLGGHQLDMQPNTYLRSKVDPKVRARNQRGIKNIIGD